MMSNFDDLPFIPRKIFLKDTAAQSEVNTANLRIQVEARLSELSRALLDLNAKVENSIQKQNLLEQTVIDRLGAALSEAMDRYERHSLTQWSCWRPKETRLSMRRCETNANWCCRERSVRKIKDKISHLIRCVNVSFILSKLNSLHLSAQFSHALLTRLLATPMN